jgi:hypothetical protein
LCSQATNVTQPYVEEYQGELLAYQQQAQALLSSYTLQYLGLININSSTLTPQQVGRGIGSRVEGEHGPCYHHTASSLYLNLRSDAIATCIAIADSRG